ncbi:MAG: NUDIX domain-containing protein [Proteobacteria bacterium]|nr:NUDIX domain-containing protein [Pseudomonadota bacterium]
MQRRAPGRSHAGLWEFPGGKLEHGEGPEAALVREVREELALDLAGAVLEPVGFAADPAPGGVRIELYLCRSWHGEPHCLDAAELGWFAPPAIPALAMPPLDYPLADALLRSLGAI